MLRTLWETDAPRSVAEIRAELAEKVGWKATTVKTLLYSLRDKGVIEEVQRGIYRPVARESDIMKEIIRKLYNGSAKKLVASLLSNGELSERDVAELRLMLTGGGLND
ncbi:MAG: BlaI/MecI/CopY family transcriptional regulator [Defluviitaleaceae bacterium]|nr:BlaI/MecI/CopY family transcriptional regulator [Defluviitaleaceae bacterium]